MKIQKSNSPPTDRIDPDDDRLKVGDWYWLKQTERRLVGGGEGDEVDDDYDPDEEEWEEVEVDPVLSCIVRLGSNYAKLKSVGGSSWRVHFDTFHEECTPEHAPDPIIDGKIGRYQEEVRSLMNEVKQLTAGLGITTSALPDNSESPSQALAVASGTDDIKKHKDALIKAKEKTLPELFDKIEEAHGEMAEWMKAKLIPMEAEAYILRKSTDVIADRIFTVELYAGLCEEVAQLTEGEPAAPGTKLHVYQRRHYMDEECLAQYESGGMDFNSLGEFNRWFTRKDNRTRLLPSERCVVAFRIRRTDKSRTASSIAGLLAMFMETEADKQTYLYMRNGERTYLMKTSIDFGEQLFPDKDHSILLGGEKLWMNRFGHRVDNIVTEAQYLGLMDDYRKERAEYEAADARWTAATEKERSAHADSQGVMMWPGHGPQEPEYEPFDQDSLYYDDTAAQIAQTAKDHNRVAVVLQGLLDRSPVFHPHPPWKLWTPEGFKAGIELVYDDSRALTDGDPPDFKAYRSKLAESIEKGTLTIGQEDLWERAMAERENQRRCREYSMTHFTPYGDPGPGLIAEVVKTTRTGKATFGWERERKTYNYYNNSPLPTKFTCSMNSLLNVDAYKEGDFKVFFADPRTRARYLQWAPQLLAAEDYVVKQRKKAEKKARKRARSKARREKKKS